jgi:hypothetical protein
MEMPMPDNSLPMMAGFGPLGPLEIGGMFSVVKVREGLGMTNTRTRAGINNALPASPTSLQNRHRMRRTAVTWRRDGRTLRSRS